MPTVLLLQLTRLYIELYFAVQTAHEDNTKHGMKENNK